MKTYQSTIDANSVRLNDATHGTTVCHNLRPRAIPARDTFALQPVGQPTAIAAASWQPLTEMTTDAGHQLLIVADNTALAAVRLDRPAQPAVLEAADGIINIATLDSKPLCAVSSGSLLTVMTAAGPREWLYSEDDGSWIDTDANQWPAMSLTAVDGADCQTTVAPRRLSSDYNASNRSLSPTDLRAVTSDLRQAYTDIAAQAAADGKCCAPRVAAYRLIGHEGQNLFTSPPLLLSSSDSDALTAPLTVTSSDRRTLDSYTVAARSWSVRLSSSAPVNAAMAAMVSRIEILASPQFHPYDPDAQASVNLVNIPASDAMLRITMPGAALTLSAANGAAAEARLRRTLGVIDRSQRVIATIQGPFTTGQTIDIEPAITAAYNRLSDEFKDLNATLAARPAPVDSTLARIAPPHRFSASCVASAAGSTLWGNLNASHFEGFPVESFAAERAGAGAWHAAAAVTFASGDEQLVTLSQGSEGAPIKFNPLISYPSPDAVAITLIVSAAGSVRRDTLPLTPDPSGRRAVYVDPSLNPFRLRFEAPAFVVPSHNPLPRPMPSFVAVSDTRQPRNALAAASIGGGEVNVLFAASRSQSSWDFSRTRFTVLSSTGIYTASYARGRAPALSLNCIDSRTVNAPTAACDAAGRVVAVAGRDLIDIGVSKVRTLVSNFDADRLAYDSVNGELWATSSTSATTAVVNLDNLTAYTRDETVDSQPVGQYALISGKLCQLGRENSRSSTFVRWDTIADLGRDFVRPAAMTIDMRSSAFNYGNLSLTRLSHSDAEPAPSLRLSLSGAVGSPLTVAMRPLPTRRLALSLQGRAAPDTLLSSITLRYFNPNGK